MCQSKNILVHIVKRNVKLKSETRRGKNNGKKKKRKKEKVSIISRIYYISGTLVRDMQKHDYNPLASGQNRIQSPSFPLPSIPGCPKCAKYDTRRFVVASSRDN